MQNRLIVPLRRRIDRVHTHVEMQRRAGLAVQPGDEIGNLGSDAAAHRRRPGLDHGHVQATLARRGGYLQPDHPGADAQHAARTVQTLAQPAGILDRAQSHRVLAARHGKAASPAAGCEQQPVVGVGGAVIEAHALADRIDRHGGAAADELDAKFFVAPLGVEILHRRLGAAGQPRLGQGRPFIGAPGLVADQQDAAAEAGLAHGGRGPAAGLAGAEDDVGAHRRTFARSAAKRHISGAMVKRWLGASRGGWHPARLFRRIDGMAEWVRVATAAEIAEGQMLGVRAGGKDLLVCHLPGGEFRCTDNICTHEYALLSDGCWRMAASNARCMPAGSTSAPARARARRSTRISTSSRSRPKAASFWSSSG